MYCAGRFLPSPVSRLKRGGAAAAAPEVRRAKSANDSARQRRGPSASVHSAARQPACATTQPPTARANTYPTEEDARNQPTAPPRRAGSKREAISITPGV
jgi:hypothetical protein